MTHWQRPTVSPISKRRAVGDRLRRTDPYIVAKRVLIASLAVLLAQLGWRWRSATIDLGRHEILVVMEQSVARGRPVTPADVRLASWPIGLTPEGALAELPLGAIAEVDLVAGEVLLAERLFPDGNGLHPGQRLVTIPPPLAGSPASAGSTVELFGLLPIGEGVTTPAVRLAEGTVVATKEGAIFVAVDAAVVPTIVEHLALGSIEIIISP